MSNKPKIAYIKREDVLKFKGVPLQEEIVPFLLTYSDEELIDGIELIIKTSRVAAALIVEALNSAPNLYDVTIEEITEVQLQTHDVLEPLDLTVVRPA